MGEATELPRNTKKCPFCAEEIKSEAIKCKHCGSSLTADGDEGAALVPEAGRAGSPHPDEPRVTLYEGCPSWQAFFGTYFVTVLSTLAVVAGAIWLEVAKPELLDSQGLALAIGIPLVFGAIVFFCVTLSRRSQKVRISNRSIESEVGILSKRIDVTELWRVRDVRYKQTFLNRVLGVAHIEVFTKDVTTPQMEIFGLPASRKLFEKLRDSIEIQRQSKRVMGLID